MAARRNSKIFQLDFKRHIQKEHILIFLSVFTVKNEKKIMKIYISERNNQK